MITEAYTWLQNVTNHALLIWIDFLLVSAIWFTTVWAVRKWAEFYKHLIKK